MLPGGMMPVTQLIMMIRSTSPQTAAGLLMAMPNDRFPVVVTALGTSDITRLLPVARPDLRDRLIAALTTAQLVDLIRVAPADQAVTLISALPDERLRAIADTLPDQVAARLLTSLPDDRRTALLATMDPRRVYAAQSAGYEREVADALIRANAAVTVPDGVPAGILLIETLGWRVAVAARHSDDGRVAVRDAEHSAYLLSANAALSVTDLPPAEEVVRYCHESQRQGRRLDAVSWRDDRNDSLLKRALVGLVRN